MQSSNANNKSRSKPPVACDKEVKELARLYLHKKCTCAKRRIYASKVKGKKINDWIYGCMLAKGEESLFNDESKRLNSRKQYMVCNNLKLMIDKCKELSPSIRRVTSTIPSLLSAVVPPVADPISRQERIEKYNSARDNVMIRGEIIEDAAQHDEEIEQSDDEVCATDDDEENEYNCVGRIGQNEKFEMLVLEGCSKYRKSFGDCKMRTRRERMNEVLRLALSICIDTKGFNINELNLFLHSNKLLCIDVINLLDGVKELLLKKCKVSKGDVESEATPPRFDDDEGLVQQLNDTNPWHELALALLGEGNSTRSYKRIRKHMQTRCNKSLPTYYSITKDCPKIEGKSIKVNSYNNQCETVPETIDDNTTVHDLAPTNIDTAGENEEEILRAMRQQEYKKELLMYQAKITGNYSDYITILENKHRENGRTIEEGDEVIVLDSVDGAEHFSNKQVYGSVISYSASLTNPRWLNEKQVTSGASVNILTYQQVQGKEDLQTMRETMGEFLEKKKQLREKSEHSSQHYHYYEMHDGKMLYNLTGHSLWNRKFHPFLLCTCKRGESFSNPNHVCKVMTNEDSIENWNNSVKRWNKCVGHRRYPGYGMKRHRDWADEKNYGITHFGFHPSLFPPDKIRFDCFHLKCAITRRLMAYLREFLLEQSESLFKNFTISILEKFYKAYHVYCWNNKKNFSSFKGNELALFVASIPKIVLFLNNSIELTPQLKDICEGLELYHDIFEFLGITYIEKGEEERYKERIDIFEEQVSKLYEVGGRTFLSKNGKPTGSEETFYFHVLRYYVMKIARETLAVHGVGVGLFNMQGFERRNKESKVKVKNSSNGRGNVLIHNMKKLYIDFRDNNKNR